MITAKIKKWVSGDPESRFLVSWIFICITLLALFVALICVSVDSARKSAETLYGDQQVGIIIINENQYRLDGLDAFNAATKEIRLIRYEHIIVDGIDYFIWRK